MRILHTMLRVGDLQRSVRFYTEVLGMKLLRTTDRPEQKYLARLRRLRRPRSARAVLELTYNYGVERYELGGAFGHIAIGVPDVTRRVRKVRGARRQGHARGRPGQGRQQRDRVRRRPRRLQDRVHRAQGRLALRS